MMPKDHDARLLSLPEGVQVMRDGRIRYHWYNQMSLASIDRLWGLMDRSLQLASEPNTYIWKGQRGTNTATESAVNLSQQLRWRVETHQFGYIDIQYANTRREARTIRAAMVQRPQTEQSHVVDTQPPRSRRTPPVF